MLALVEGFRRTVLRNHEEVNKTILDSDGKVVVNELGKGRVVQKRGPGDRGAEVGAGVLEKPE